MAGGLGGVHFLDRAFSVPGIALRMIRSSVENPSGTSSAKALRLMGLVVSVLVKDVGGSGFIVRVSGAPKFKGGDGLFEGKVGNICSKNLQFVNLALSKFPVAGLR